MPTATPALASVADNPDAVLTRIRVTRDGKELRRAALWQTGSRRASRELVELRDGELVSTAAPDAGDLRRAFPAPGRSTGTEASDVLGRLLPWEATSFERGVRVVLGGGDGATLFPFEAVARSEEYDDWSVRPLPLFEGARAYSSGAVALADGRLVALLGAFSDDRGARHRADRHHGLWASDGDDWSTYSPWKPTFEPPLTGEMVSLEASHSPDPVVWVTTSDRRVYVADGRLRVFREVAVR